MDKLKSCPFCGGKARHYTDKFNTLGAYGSQETEKQWHSIGCPKCKVKFPKRTFYSLEEAIEAWNRRAEDGK